MALALEKHIHTSEGVAHILIYTNESDPAIESLANWAKLPAPDVSLYGCWEVCNDRRHAF